MTGNSGKIHKTKALQDEGGRRIEEAGEDLRMFLGFSPSVRSNEARNRTVAQIGEPFRESRRGRRRRPTRRART